MHTTAELLDAAKSRIGITSDYKLAAILNVSGTATVTNYRKGRSHPDDMICARIADMAGLEAGYVMACVHAQRAASPEVRRVWEGVAEQLKKAGVAAVLAMVGAVCLPAPDASASAHRHGASEGGSVYYVKRRRLFRGLARAMAAGRHQAAGLA
jgi:hypothetical protein